VSFDRVAPTRSEGSGPAVRFLQAVLLLQFAEIAPDRHLRHIQQFAEFFDCQKTAFVYQPDDFVKAFSVCHIPVLLFEVKQIIRSKKKKSMGFG
jgi:hypothetical protein